MDPDPMVTCKQGHSQVLCGIESEIRLEVIEKRNDHGARFDTLLALRRGEIQVFQETRIDECQSNAGAFQ